METNITIPIKKEEEKSSTGLNVDFFLNSNNTQLISPISDIDDNGVKKKSRSVVKKETAVVESNNNLTHVQSNEPYMESYTETNNLLKNSIVQVDILANEIKGDIDIIRASKTLKNKYGYLTDLTGTAASLISTKLTAIRELNNTITKTHDLELKRVKELNIAGKEDDDDRRISDMYSAFINTPVGVYGPGMGPLGPTVTDMTMLTGVDMSRGDVSSTEIGYNSYNNNLSPEQNLMRQENNPNIQTVVIFNQDTGQRYFDVIDKTTGVSVPNLPRPDAFLLEDTNINTNTLMARNLNLDTTYPVILVGSNKSILEY